MQKFFAIMTNEQVEALREDTRLYGADFIQSPIDKNRYIVTITSRHSGLRWDLENEGHIILPGPHDPGPIDNLHQHLAHIDAKPQHTMREVALRLFKMHGPSFHPDT